MISNVMAIQPALLTESITLVFVSIYNVGTVSNCLWGWDQVPLISLYQWVKPCILNDTVWNVVYTNLPSDRDGIELWLVFFSLMLLRVKITLRVPPANVVPHVGHVTDIFGFWVMNFTNNMGHLQLSFLLNATWQIFAIVCKFFCLHLSLASGAAFLLQVTYFALSCILYPQLF